VDLLKKWVWEKYRKNIDYKQLIDASEIDVERSTAQYSFNRQEDLLVPLTYNKDFWGQLVVEKGADLSTHAISQIVDLADLYFKLKVSSWTSEARSTLFEEQPEGGLNKIKGPPKIYFLKSATPEKSNYIISFLQEKLAAQGKLPWDKNYDLEDESLDSVIIHINDIQTISREDLLRMAYSDRKPQIVITSSSKLSDWHTWSALKIELQTKLAIIDADLDTMPLTLSEAKDCIDLLWFAD
jgi:hypothetical protein